MSEADGIEAEFPIGAWVHDWVQVRACLRGTLDRGQYLGVLRDGERLLVTTSTRQTVDLGDLYRALELGADGVAPLRDILDLAHPLGGDYACLVEELPAGRPSTELPWPLDLPTAARLGLGLCDALDDSHEHQGALGGIRPELVFVDGEPVAVTAIAPRAERFFATASPSCHGVVHCFDQLYMAPEMLAQRPLEPAADVFALCAVLATWTDRPPFDGSMLDQLTAISTGTRPPYRGPARLRELIDAGLAVAATARPSVDEVRRVLTGLA